MNLEVEDFLIHFLDFLVHFLVVNMWRYSNIYPWNLSSQLVWGDELDWQFVGLIKWHVFRLKFTPLFRSRETRSNNKDNIVYEETWHIFEKLETATKCGILNYVLSKNGEDINIREQNSEPHL